MKRFSAISTALAALLVAASSVADVVEEGPTAPEPKADEQQAEGPSKVVRLPLEDLIARAIRNSPKLAAERHRLAAVQAQVDQLWWFPLSNIGVTGLLSVVPDRCIDTGVLESEGRVVGCDGGSVTGDDDYWSQDWGPYFSLEVKGTIPLYTFNKISNAKDAANAGLKAKEAMLPTFANEIRYNVQRAYHAIVGAREMLYTIGEGSKKLAAARKKVEENLENQEGTETEIDLIKLKVFESEVANMIVLAKQIERTGLAALRFLVGGADAAQVDIPEDPQEQIRRELEDLDTYQDRAVQSRPELEALRHALKAIEAKVALRRSEFFPDIGFIFDWRWVRTPGRTDLDNWVLKDSYNYGGYMPAMALGMTYKLDIGMDVHRLKEAKAELAAITADQRLALEGILLEVETTYIEVVTARDSVDALEKSRRLAKGWLAAAVQSHAAGLGAAKEVKDALKEYFMVMAQLHQRIGEFNAGLAKLDRVTGQLETAEKKSE